MVWIHGGGFYGGSGGTQMYGPQYLLDKDIILVTMNYRLGTLGTLKRLNHLLYVLYNTCHIYQGITKVSSHSEYLKNRSRALDISWQSVRGDLTVHPRTVTAP